MMPRPPIQPLKLRISPQSLFHDGNLMPVHARPAGGDVAFVNHMSLSELAVLSECPMSLNHPRAESEWKCPDLIPRCAASLLAVVLTMLLFRTLLISCVSRWNSEPQYSHGWVIPLIAVWLGWCRRSRILPGTARSSAQGFVLLGLAVVGHSVAEYLYIEAIDAAAFLACISGCVMLIWGRRFFLAVWPAALFLGFMIPLPFQIERMLSDPLQVLGAEESVWCIQTLGIPAIAVGNTILMGDTRLGVADACSGLRMLMVFLAISSAAVIVSQRTPWEKLLMLFSAIPIALACNITRIVATAVAHNSLGRETADLVFHDLSGWLMMPLAMLLLYLELRLFDWVFIEQESHYHGPRKIRTSHEPSI
jgi:exosortase